MTETTLIAINKPFFFDQLSAIFGPEWAINFSEEKNQIFMENDFLTKEIFNSEAPVIRSIINPNVNGWEVTLQTNCNKLRIVIRKSAR